MKILLLVAAIALLSFEAHAKTIAAGDAFTCVIRNKAVYCWGMNQNGESGADHSKFKTVSQPTVVDLGSKKTPVKIAVGGVHACVLFEDKTGKCWGFNGNGELGSGGSEIIYDKAQDIFGGTDMEDIVVGDKSTCVRVTNGKVYCWGYIGGVQVKVPKLLSDAPVGAIAQNTMGYCADFANSVLCYGNYVVDSLSDVAWKMTGTSTIKQLEVGDQFICALSGKGNVLCDGRYYKRFPNGSEWEDASPKQQPFVAMVGAKSISAGKHHVCGVTLNGEVACWGADWIGEFGQGNSGQHSPSAALVPGLTDVVEVASGHYHTCALTKSGDVKCWGSTLYDAIGPEQAASNMTYPASDANSAFCISQKLGGCGARLGPLTITGLPTLSSGGDPVIEAGGSATDPVVTDPVVYTDFSATLLNNVFMSTYFNLIVDSLEGVTPLNFSEFKTQGAKHVFTYKTDKATYSAWCDDTKVAKCPKVVDVPWAHVGGAQFDGSTNWVVVPTLTNQLPLSVGGWFCRDYDYNNGEIFVGKSGNAGEDQLLLGMWNYELRLTYGAQTWDIMPATAGCHHVVVNVEKYFGANAATVGKVRLQVYIDGGNQTFTYYAKNPLPVEGRDWALGQKWTGNTPSNFFQGQMYGVFVTPISVRSPTVKSLYELNLKVELNAASKVDKPGVVNGQCEGTCPTATAIGGAQFEGKNFEQLPPGTVGPVFEWSFWVKPDAANDQAFLGKHDAKGNDQLLVGFWGGALQVKLGVNNVKIMPAFVGWHKLNLQVAYKTLTSTTLTVYHDGVLVYANDVTHSPIDLDSGRPWVVGQEWDGDNPSDFFTGNLWGLNLHRAVKSKSLQSEKTIVSSFNADKKAVPALAVDSANAGGSAGQKGGGGLGIDLSGLVGTAENSKNKTLIDNFWNQEGEKLTTDLKSVLQYSKEIQELRTKMLIGESFLKFGVLDGSDLSNCVGNIEKAPKDKVEEWISANCKSKNMVSEEPTNLAANFSAIKELYKKRKESFISIRTKVADVLTAVQKLPAGSVLTGQPIQNLSRATSVFFTALTAAISDYDLTFEKCEDPLLTSYMLDDMLNNDSGAGQKAKDNPLTAWANVVGCQHPINLNYADRIMREGYLGTLALINTTLDKNPNADLLRIGLLRDLSPFNLILFDANKKDTTVPSRAMLNEYSAVVRDAINGKVAVGGSMLYPTSVVVQNSQTKAFSELNLCSQGDPKSLIFSTLPEDKSTYKNLPLLDKWLNAQWKKLSCDTQTKWSVSASEKGLQCFSLPNLLDVATNAVTLGDGSCPLWTSALNNLGCCPDFIKNPKKQ